MKLLRLGGGSPDALMDEADQVRFSAFQWGIDDDGLACAEFPAGRGKVVRVWLHRLIMAPEPHWHVWHKNGTKWDLRRENLGVEDLAAHLSMHPLYRRVALTVERQLLWEKEAIFLAKTA